MSFFLAFKLRKASNTTEIEKKKDDLKRDFEEFEAFSKSEELKNYQELEKYVLSDEFKRTRKDIENKSYKKSELYKAEKEFKRFQKSRKFKIYFRLKDSSELSTFNMMEKSDEIARYQELESIIKSSGFNKKKQREELNEFKMMKRSSRIKEFFKFRKSKNLRIYREVENSLVLKKYFELEEEISSDGFLKEKAFLLDKKRYETTDDFKKLQEYQQLKKSEKITKYFNLKEKNPFNELKKWELTFSEEFDSSQLDQDKWLTRYYWGDKFLDKGYSLANDLHTFTDGKNISISGSSAMLQARKEKQEGLVWNSKLGFIPQDFNYTSAIVNTGKSFRQKYGRFEAKIKVSDPDKVMHSFWMVADKSTPHVNVLRTSKNGKLISGNLWGDEKKPKKNEFKVRGVDLSKGYFIYTLDWNAKELVWKINDVVVRTKTEGVPQDPMYLNFSLGVIQEQNSLNAAMEIDWVRCYQRKE